MPVSPQWNDARLDALSREVERMRSVVTEVAVMRAEITGLTRELRETRTATREVGEQMEKAQLEPVVRIKNFRHQVTIAVVSALLGGGVLAILHALASTH